VRAARLTDEALALTLDWLDVKLASMPIRSELLRRRALTRALDPMWRLGRLIRAVVLVPEGLLDDEAVEAATVGRIDPLATADDACSVEDIDGVAGAPWMTFESRHGVSLRELSPLRGSA
jgi:hypothetical protein